VAKAKIKSNGAITLRLVVASKSVLIVADIVYRGYQAGSIIGFGSGRPSALHKSHLEFGCRGSTIVFMGALAQ
jgi:hypothetical protein